MTQTMAPLQITDKQHNYIVDLAAKRPTWIGILTGDAYETVVDVLLNEQIRMSKKVDPSFAAAEKFIPLKVASFTIGKLLAIKPSAIVPVTPATPAPAPKVSTPAPASVPTATQRLRQLIQTMPNGSNVKLAVEIEGVWEFFSLDEVKKYGKVQYRSLRKLSGAPGGWHRHYLSVPTQLEIMRQVLAVGWEQAAKDYATQHGRCARCDAHLSDPQSIAAKVGEHCATEWGWPW